MSNNKDVQKMRKINMKIFPTYKKLAWDYLFFYTIDFLFLTQIKNISAADVVLKSSFYSFFGIILQIPANIIIEFLGRKNSIILANILNCFYMVILMLSRNIYDLIFAEFFSSIAFSIKNIAEPSLLSESIPPSKYKSKIFSKINSKGASGYYFLGAISKIVAGYMFQINGYLPIVCSLIILVIVVLMSMCFIEPVKKKTKKSNELILDKQLKDIRDGFKFIFKSERLKALILSSALIGSLLAITLNYEVSLLEEIGISSLIIGFISAAQSLASSYGSNKEIQFHNKFRNKTLITIAMMISISCIISGICGLKNATTYILLIIIATYLINSFGKGVFYAVIDKYLGNFANRKIDIKIYAVNNLFSSIVKVLSGVFASFLLNKMSTAYSMIVIGSIFTIMYILMEKYMKTRVGLKPEQYTEEERKYDELKK